MSLQQQQIEKAVTELKLSPEARARLEASLDTYAQLSADAKLLQEQADVEKSIIGKVLADYGYDRVATNEFSLCWVKGATTSKLEPLKLLAMGVTNAQIESATVTKPKRPYFMIRKRGSDGPVDNG